MDTRIFNKVSLQRFKMKKTHKNQIIKIKDRLRNYWTYCSTSNLVFTNGNEFLCCSIFDISFTSEY